MTGKLTGLDISLLTQVFTGDISDPDTVLLADLNGDGVVDDDDMFLFNGPMLYQSNDPNVLRGSGDANGDKSVDGRDIAAFIDKLLNGIHGDEPLREQFGPDMNRDGRVTMDDLPLFVQTLLSR